MPRKLSYSPSWDLGTIPDPALKSEWARRSAGKRKTFAGGSGRPRLIRPCPQCAAELSAREMRVHRCG